MKTSVLTLLGFAFSVVISACGGDAAAPPASSPANQDPTKVDPSSVGASMPEPSGPANGVSPTSAAPASPADGGKCKSGAPSPTATALDTCLKSCEGLDDTVPPNSRCISAKTSCASQCNTKFKK